MRWRGLTRVKPAPVEIADWYLSTEERGNPSTGIDRRHADGLAWTEGNEVRPLVHGATYFAELRTELCRMGPGDIVLFTDWRGDPDERLDGPGSEVSRLFEDAAKNGAIVKGLIWRSHLDRLQFSEAENRHLGEDIESAGGQCLRDMRVRVGGSHHQKMVVLRHRDHPEWDVAYLGGIDLCHSRRDTADHRGDPQAQSMADEYGPHPAWHDVQLAIRGPAVGDVEATFRERWDDRTPLSRNPVHRLRDLLDGEDTHPRPLPPQWPDPPVCGEHPVQVLRTYPHRLEPFPFAPAGERSVARAYLKVLRRARHLIYLEDQYLWSEDVARVFAQALEREPDLRLIAVVPLHPDEDGLAAHAQYHGREKALRVLRAAGGDRVTVYGLENHDSMPVYVHAKVCVVDDTWACVGSDNLNLRSWTYDSELSGAVCHPGFARDLRLRLAAEHLDGVIEGGDVEGTLGDGAACAEAFARAAERLDAWYAGGRVGPRPPGRLRAYLQPRTPRWARLPAALLYRVLCDPDGRPRSLRRAHEF